MTWQLLLWELFRQECSSRGKFQREDTLRRSVVVTLGEAFLIERLRSARGRYLAMDRGIAFDMAD